MSDIVVLRVIHVLGGVYWAGAILFIALFLEPSVRAAGPDGAKVMQALIKRRHLDVLPIVAALTLLTGIELYRRASVNFNLEWMGSRQGLILTTGSLAAIVAFAIGVLVMRPAAKRVASLGPTVQQLPEGAEREAGMAQVQALRARVGVTGRVVAALLTVTVLAMAVARYL